MHSIFDKVTGILAAELFNIKAPISLEDAFESYPGWDSMKHLAFLLQLEEAFSMEILPEDISKIKTVNDVLKFISKFTSK